jgi:hypothetical protein
VEKLPVSNQEKEKKVCELIRQRKNVRDIAALVHLSFSDIARIREKYFDIDETDVVTPSKRSQELKLIQEGKLNVDIAMELDLSAEEMLGFRKEYLTLKDDDDLLEIYRSVDVRVLLEIYKEMKIEELSPEEAIIALNENKTFEQMSLKYDSMLKKFCPLSREVEQLTEQRNALLWEIQELTWNLEDLEEKNYLMSESRPLSENKSWVRNVRRRPRVTENLDA